MYHPSLSVFMTNKTPIGARKQLKDEIRNSQNGQNSFLSFVTMVYTKKKRALYIRSTPSLFHNFKVLPGTCNHSLNNHDFQLGTPFSSFVCTLADLKSLSNDMKLLLKITELEIQ